MQNNRFGRRSYATAVAAEDDITGNVSGVSPRQRMANRAVNEGRNLRKEAETKKRYFQQKLNLEGNSNKNLAREDTRLPFPLKILRSRRGVVS